MPDIKTDSIVNPDNFRNEIWPVNMLKVWL